MYEYVEQMCNKQIVKQTPVQKPLDDSFDFDAIKPEFHVPVSTLQDLDEVRNTLDLLEQIRVQATTFEELRSDVCREIYYSIKNVSEQITKHVAKFQKALTNPALSGSRYDQISELLVHFMSMTDYIDQQLGLFRTAYSDLRNPAVPVPVVPQKPATPENSDEKKEFPLDLVEP